MRRHFPLWDEYMLAPIVPEMYLNTKSFEQFAADISCEYNKLINYIKDMSSTVNEQYAIIERLQDLIPDLVNDDTGAYMSENLNDPDSVLYGIVSTTVDEWADDRTEQVDENTAAIAEFNNGSTYGDIENNGFVYREV